MWSAKSMVLWSSFLRVRQANAFLQFLINIHIVYHFPTPRVLGAQCANFCAPLKGPVHGYAHAQLVWIALDTYDYWIIWDLLNILQKRCHSLRVIYGPLFPRKFEAQIEATGTPARRAIAAYSLRQTALSARQADLVGESVEV